MQIPVTCRRKSISVQGGDEGRGQAGIGAEFRNALDMRTVVAMIPGGPGG